MDKYEGKTDSSKGKSREDWDFRESHAMGFLFANSMHLYGLPERADRFQLRTTESSDPYRLYNVDVFPHDEWSPEGLYGSIPYITSHAIDHDVSIIWMNSAETWTEIRKKNFENKSTRSYNDARLVDFLSESGKMEFFIVASAAKSANPAHRV